MDRRVSFQDQPHYMGASRDLKSSKEIKVFKASCNVSLEKGRGVGHTEVSLTKPNRPPVNRNSSMLIRKKNNLGTGDVSRSQFYTDVEPKKKPPPRPPPPKTQKSGIGWNQKLNDLWNHKSDDPWKQNSKPDDPWKQNSKPDDPWKQNSKADDPWKRNSKLDDPWKQNSNQSSSHNAWQQSSNSSASSTQQWAQRSSSVGWGDAWGSSSNTELINKPRPDWANNFNSSWSQKEPNDSRQSSVDAWGSSSSSYSAGPVPQPRRGSRDTGAQDLINWSSPHPSPSLSLHSDGTSIGSAGTDSQQTNASTSSGFDEDFDPFSPACLEKNKRSSRILGPKVLPTPVNINDKNKSMVTKSTTKPPVASKPSGLASSTETYPISKPTVIKPKPKPRVKSDIRTSPTFGTSGNSARSTPEPWNRGSPVPQSRRSSSPYSDPGNRWSTGSRPLSGTAQQWDSQSTHSHSSTSDAGGTRQWDSSRSVSPAPWSNLYSNQENIYNHIEDSREESPPMPCQPAPQLPSGVDYHEPSPPPLPPRPQGADAGNRKPQPHGVALYDYEASQEDDLEFKANDTIILLRCMNKDWMWGQIGQKEGLLPSNFIQVVVPLPGQKTATALYSFQATHADEISFPEGAVIEVLAKSGTEWLSGRYEDKEGLFPANFIDFVPENLPELS